MKFEQKVSHHFNYLEERGINYAKSIYNLTGNVNSSADGLLYELKSSRNPENIRFTTNGEMPNWNSQNYSGPIPVKERLKMQESSRQDSRAQVPEHGYL